MQVFQNKKHGNKMNLKLEILENLLNTCGDGAKGNSLRQAIKRNKSDMADNTTKSLDVLRQVFQHEMTDEIRQIIDRHLRTTFAPAFENLKRNGHAVLQADIDELCVAILDGAKQPFLPPPASLPPPTLCISSSSVLKDHAPDLHQTEIIKSVYESDDNENESDGSMISQNSSLVGPLPGGLYGQDSSMRRCGTPLIQGTQPVTASEAIKWNPERMTKDSRFILGSKVNKALALGHRGHIFGKYSRAYRYVADDEDKAWLFDRNISTRMSGKVFFMLLEDVIEIAQLENASVQVQKDLQRYSFIVPDKMVQKMKSRMSTPFDQLKARVVAGAQHTNNFQNFVI
uniref:DNTTIP1 dimerisation domain-containing protein n=1 Tax=Ditylenchus dipsaci TaxID=166011 RepID=A0A915CTV4_9BILA